jgi:hypothetical protein
MDSTRCRWTLALFSIVTSTAFLAAQSVPLGRVHIEAVGPFGAPARDVKVNVFSPDRKREIPNPGQSSMISAVPYGKYIVVVQDNGGSIGEREIFVNAKEIWVRVGLPLPTGDRAWPGGDLNIRGEIMPHPVSDRDWWVRVEGVYLNRTVESRIVQGRFSIEGLEMGAYLVEVFDGPKIRHVETVDIDTREPERRLTIVVDERSVK